VRLGLLGNGLVHSGPFTLSASRPGYTLTRRDVLVGEVWLVSGQSNAVFALGDIITGSATFKARAQSELQAATDSKIRTFQVPRNFSTAAQTNVYGSWNVTSPGVIERFSAIGYLLAKKLRSKINVPIGILESDFGGTSITSWLPPEKLQEIGGVPLQEADPTQNLYNGMITNLGRDFGGFDVNGVVWYQGESDGGLTASNPLYSMYQGLLAALLSTWRTTFGFPTMPFVIVQLAAFIPRYAQNKDPFRSNLNHWPFVREAQRQVALTDPNAYLATAVDIGNDHVVHPPNKFDVALRVARQACHNIYGFSDMQGGPTYRSAVRNTGGSVTLSFDDTSSKLVLGIKDNRTVTTVSRVSGTAASCFQLQDTSGAWRNATAALQSDNLRIKVGPVSGVSAPSGVRYAWFDGWPKCNVYSSAQLPLVPFTEPL
jgi:sialate O-acetylesterase